MTLIQLWSNYKSPPPSLKLSNTSKMRGEKWQNNKVFFNKCGYHRKFQNPPPKKQKTNNNWKKNKPNDFLFNKKLYRFTLFSKIFQFKQQNVLFHWFSCSIDTVWISPQFCFIESQILSKIHWSYILKYNCIFSNIYKFELLFQIFMNDWHIKIFILLNSYCFHLFIFALKFVKFH